MLRRFYQWPTLAPNPAAPEDDVTTLVSLGILVPEDESVALLRKERCVTWWIEKSAIHLLLAASVTGQTMWFEHDGRGPVLFVHKGEGLVLSGGLLCSYDGRSFGFESPGSVALSKNKAATHTFLTGLGYPVPPQIMVYPQRIQKNLAPSAKRAIVCSILQSRPEGFHFPVVVKPVDESMGEGVAFVRDEDELVVHLMRIAKQRAGVCWAVIETAVQGREWRVTVLADGSYAVYERRKFAVQGDGRATIRELVERQQHVRREIVRCRDYLRPPSLLNVGTRELDFLARQGYNLDTVPDVGQQVALVERPHATLGGLYYNVTKRVPTRLVDTLQEIRVRMGLSRAGFDIIGKSLCTDAIIIEVNGRPHLWPHIEPDYGDRECVAETMLSLALGSSGQGARELLKACIELRVNWSARVGNRMGRWMASLLGRLEG